MAAWAMPNTRAAGWPAPTGTSAAAWSCHARRGAGRIEVANLSMVAHTQVYLNDFSGALATSQTAVELAARVGHHRAEIIAHDAACNVFRTTGEFGRARPHAERALALARQLGAKRFEAVCLNDLAMVARAEAGRREALDLLHRALAISRETGLSFMGPWILGHLAVMTEDPVERRAALAEGEEILRKGAVGHNHFWFFRYAIDASLSSRDWDGAERYSAALEDYTRPEPLPWADFFVRYGRALLHMAGAARTADDKQAWRSGGRGRAPRHRTGAWAPPAGPCRKLLTLRSAPLETPARVVPCKQPIQSSPLG